MMALSKFMIHVENDNVPAQNHLNGHVQHSLNGGTIYSHLFEPFIDEVYMTEGSSILDFGHQDQESLEQFKKKIKDKSIDDIYMHILGLDHFHHLHGFQNLEKEREYLPPAYDILDEVIASIDSNTTLIVYGDHGFNEGGYHGDNTWEERATICFVYTPGREFISE